MEKNETETSDQRRKRTQDHQELEVIAEAIMDVFQDTPEEESQDAFEIYSKKIRTRFYEDKENFKKKFEEGYHVLIEELSQSSK